MALDSVDTVLELDQCYYSVVVLCADDGRHNRIINKVKHSNIMGLNVVEIVDGRMKL